MHDVYCILRNCSEEEGANKVCRNGNSKNYPIELDTSVYLKEIVEINEEKNSITMQMTWYNYWTDSSLAASKTTEL